MSHNAHLILVKCNIFQTLSSESLELLSSIAREVTLEKNQVVFHQEDPCPGVFCVGSGLVRVFKTSVGGKEHILHFAKLGSTFAEIAAIGDFPCPASAEALEDSKCVLLPGAVFRKLLQTNHELCYQFTQGMAVWVRTLVGLLEDVVLRDATSRVAAFLLRQSEGNNRVQFASVMKKDVAAHLNLTSETVSRTLNRLCESGLINRMGSRELEILVPERLMEVAEGLPPSEFEG